jgi:predicted enzyme related to lactoylglutathione lyase
MSRAKSYRKSPHHRARLAMSTGSAPTVTQKGPIRGVKLKTVSRLVMLAAMLCLGAFWAGRPPVSAAGSFQAGGKERFVFLGLRTAAYQVKDLAKAKAWYASVLGIQPYFDQPFYVGFNVGGYELGLVPDPEAGPKRHPSGIAYWGVTDARGAYQRLVDLGATPQEPVQDVGEGILIGTVHDPFGNVLGVIQNPNFKTE